MWKLFSQIESDPTVYLKVETFEDVSNETPEGRLRYKITVTNYIKMWCGVYDNERIIQIMLNSNKDTETEDKQAFLDAGLQMLYEPKMLNEKVFTETQSGNLSVRLLCKTPIVLRMNFTLILCPPEEFFRSITLPLLEVINDLQSSEKKLRKHLIKKDEEIKGFMDMLPEGSPLMRCLRTEPYNDLKHMKTHSAVDTLFGTDPVEVSPGQIIQYGRALPIGDDESGMENALNDSKASKLITSSQLTEVIKIEPKESQNLTLQLQIPAVKNEPIEKLNSVVKSEPNDAVNSPIDVKNKPELSFLDNTQKYNKLGTNNVTNGPIITTEQSSSDCNNSSNTINLKCLSNGFIGQSNDFIEEEYDRSKAKENIDNTEINNDRQMDTSDTHKQSPEQIQAGSNDGRESKEGTVKSEQTNSIMKWDSCSSESIPEQKPCTPKKRRKNLNY